MLRRWTKTGFLFPSAAVLEEVIVLPGVKRIFMIAIVALVSVASTQAQVASKSKAGGAHPDEVGLPPEQNIGETVGRGDPLVLGLRLSSPKEETEITFLVDTGSTVTILDKSFERLLGSRLRKERLNRTFSGRSIEQARVYAAPRLYLGNVQLLTGPTVLTCDLAASGNNSRQEAILGMDCLKHYCVQMDFAARKLRFQESSDLKRENLGRSFSMDCATGVPVVSFKLLGERNLRFMLDSGFYQYADGTLPGEIIRPALQNHLAKDMGQGFSLFETLEIGAESYKAVSFVELQVDDGGGVAGFLGLSFMARHVVTFDFPKGLLYLQPISTEAAR